MKKLLISLFMAISFCSMADIVTAPVSHVYSPIGFDSNDNVEVAVSGWLPNLCYQSPMVSVNKSGHKIDITIKAIYTQPESHLMCAEVIVPYLETVSLGILKEGFYQIVVNAGTRFSSTSLLSVEKPDSSKRDNHIYARVLHLEKIEGSSKVLIKTELPSSCLTLDEITYKSNGRDTISVLPILKVIASDCPEDPKLVDYIFDVPNLFPQLDATLLHVRSMEGKSKNYLFQ